MFNMFNPNYLLADTQKIADTAEQLKHYIENPNLISLAAASISINKPFASNMRDHYHSSGKSLSQFVNESVYFNKTKQANEDIWNQMYYHLYYFDENIYKSPYLFPNLSNAFSSDETDVQDVLIDDDPNIYIMYILKAFKAIHADNRKYINSITNPKPIHCETFDNYQVDIRIVPHSIYGVASERNITFDPFCIDPSKVEFDKTYNLHISNENTRAKKSEEAKSDDQDKQKDDQNGMDVIKTFKFMGDIEEKREYTRFELIIVRKDKHSTRKDEIYKFIPKKGNKIPNIAVNNTSIINLSNSIGCIISKDNELKAESRGVLTISFHIKPENISLYWMYGHDGNGLIGSYSSSIDLREDLHKLFLVSMNGDNTRQDEPTISLKMDGIDYTEHYQHFDIGENTLFETTRSDFGNLRKMNMCYVRNVLPVDNVGGRILNNLAPLTSAEIGTWTSVEVLSSAASSSPMHPVEEEIKERLEAKGIFTEEHWAKAIDIAHKRGLEFRQNNASNDSPDLDLGIALPPIPNVNMNIAVNMEANEDQKSNESNDDNISINYETESGMDLQSDMEQPENNQREDDHVDDESINCQSGSGMDVPSDWSSFA